jgi:glyoxylase-like metal-dependent hydrolase (beta-lactamase superfamily II)
VNELPVAERWFRRQRVTEDVALLVEEHLDPFFESNVWHVRGRDRHLVVDTGNGIGDLRAELEPLVPDRPVVAVATHDHFDHIGGLHAFDERWCHAADAGGIREPRTGSRCGGRTSGRVSRTRSAGTATSRPSA